METIYLNQDETAVNIAKTVFPHYTGRKYSLQVTDSELHLRSYWSGGSRDYYAIVRLADMVSVPVPENGSGFTADLPAYKMQPGFAVVQHSIFCGKDTGIRIYIHPENAAKLLADRKTTELTEHESIVLCYTRSLKSSYGGISNYRFHEANHDTRITIAEWNAAKTALIERKLLSKAGAITDDGRNAIGNVETWSFRKKYGTGY